MSLLRLSPFALSALLLAACTTGLQIDPPTPDPDLFDDGDEQHDPGLTSDDADLKDRGVHGPQPMDVDPERPFSGDPVIVTVDLAGAAWIDAEVRGPGCGDLHDAAGAAPLVLTGASGQDGYCYVDAAVELADGTVQWLEGRFEIQAPEPSELPIEVLGAVFVLDEPPEGVVGSGPEILEVGGPRTFVNGAVTEHPVWVASDSGVYALVVWAEGWPGYWHLPVDAEEGGEVRLPLSFHPDFFAMGDGARTDVTVFVTALDPSDAPSAAAVVGLAGTPAGTGDVQVSVTWDAAADVDLHVFDPAGDVVYWNEETVASGGELDVDSNESCVIDGTNAENVVWDDDPPSGTYKAKVRMYADCGTGGASGTITVRACGASPAVHPFALGATGDEFEVEFDADCGPDSFKVAGRVKYEDFTVRRTGLSTNGRFVAAPYVRVQAIRASDGEVLGEDDASRAGRYEIQFANDQPASPDYLVRVVAWQESGKANQQVVDTSGDIYAWSSEQFDGAADPVQTSLNFNISAADQGAALNLWAVGVKAAEYTKRQGQTLPKATWEWQTNVTPACGTSCANGSRIWVLSTAADRDDYDDMVLGHEFGHFVHKNVAQDDSPGGPHNGPSDPRVAFGEGFATFFGCSAMGQSAYIDTISTGIAVYVPIETLPSTTTLGQVGGTLSGNIDEFVVSAILWDIQDRRQETMDTIRGKRKPIWQVLTGYLGSGSASFSNRGVAGRDLVDFLDGWICQGHGELGADDTEGLRGNVRGLHQTTYDFPALAPCP